LAAASAKVVRNAMNDTLAMRRERGMACAVVDAAAWLEDGLTVLLGHSAGCVREGVEGSTRKEPKKSPAVARWLGVCRKWGRALRAAPTERQIAGGTERATRGA
jgi:hypothetical protein